MGGIEYGQTIRWVVWIKGKKIEHAAEKYKQSKVTIGRIVGVTGLSRHEVFRELQKRGVSVQYSKNRLIKEISDLLQWPISVFRSGLSDTISSVY